MLPYIDIFGYQVSTYGIAVLIGIGCLAGVALRRAKITSLARNDVFYALLIGAIGLMIGAKLLYIATVIPALIKAWARIMESPALLLQLFTGGFVFYGGLAGAVLGVWLYCRKYHIGTLNMLDTAAPGIPLAHCFGRIGCHLAGCCYGMQVSGHGPLTVVYPAGGIAPAGVPLFPSQLTEAAINLLLFLALSVYGHKRRADGRLSGIYLIAYALIRFALEFFRGDAIRGHLFTLSTSQWISLLLLPLAVYLIWLRPRRAAVSPIPHRSRQTCE